MRVGGVAAAAAAAALLVLLALAGCSSPPVRPAPGGASTPPAGWPAGRPYYQDDGPPDRVPADLAALPDAVPRVEPLHPFANRPYVALGRSYVPDTRERPFRERGVASWYGRQFHGNRTASGERYDMFAMTAAHPTLPIPSYVRVTHLQNGRSVVVRVNDRGPFLHGRVIDLSYAAAVKLGIAGPGSGPVEVVRLLPADIARGAAGAPGEVARAPSAAPASASPAPGGATPAVEAARPSSTGAAGTAAVAVPGAFAPATVFVPNSGTAEAPATGGAAAAADPEGGRWVVQFGLFRDAAGAEALRARLGVLLSESDAPDTPLALLTLRVERDEVGWRVLVGEPGGRTDTLALAGRLARQLQRDAVLVSR